GRRRPRAPRLPPRLRPHLRALLQPRRPRWVRRHDRHDAAVPLQVPPRRRARRGARPPRRRGGDAAACPGPHRGRGEAGARRPRGRRRRARAARRHAPPAGRAGLRRVARRLRGRQPRLHGAGRQPAHDRVDPPGAPRGRRRLREGLRQPRDGGRGRAAPGGAPMTCRPTLVIPAALASPTFAVDQPAELSRAPIRLDAAQQQAIGLTWGTAERRPVEKMIRTVGRLDFDERRLAQVTLKVSGFIEELYANYTGQPVRKGDPLFTLYKLADLSTIWVYCDVYEYELPFVKVGQEAALALTAYPEQRFTARVAYVAPMLDAKTRTAKVRFELPNSPDQLLRPEMYGTVELRVPLGERLVVPRTAVLDSGRRQVVFADGGDGRLVPREVRLGGRFDDAVEVLDGVAAGERVVTSANFLVDSESKLQAAESTGAASTRGPRASPWAAPGRWWCRSSGPGSRRCASGSRSGWPHDRPHHRVQRAEPLPGHPAGRARERRGRVVAPHEPARRPPRPLRRAGDRLHRLARAE